MNDQEFEDWFKREFPTRAESVSWNGDQDGTRELARRAWNHSRAALLVRLPQRWSLDGFESGYVKDPEGHLLDYTEMTHALINAGVQYK